MPGKRDSSACGMRYEDSQCIFSVSCLPAAAGAANPPPNPVEAVLVPAPKAPNEGAVEEVAGVVPNPPNAGAAAVDVAVPKAGSAVEVDAPPEEKLKAEAVEAGGAAPNTGAAPPTPEEVPKLNAIRNEDSRARKRFLPASNFSRSGGSTVEIEIKPGFVILFWILSKVIDAKSRR